MTTPGPFVTRFVMSLKKASLASALWSREIEPNSYRRDRITSSILANLITKVNKKVDYILYVSGGLNSMRCRYGGYHYTL